MLLVAVCNLLPSCLGVYQLTSIARGLVANSQHNWTVAIGQVVLSMVISLTCVVVSYFHATKPVLPETETVEQILARYNRKIKQDLAAKITGGLL